MKSKNIAGVTGISLLQLVVLAGISFSGGCKSPVILAPKPYIPAPAEDLPAAEPELKVDYKAPETVQVDIKEAAPAPADIKLAIKPVKSKLLKYKVVRGDSFWLISHKYGVSPTELASYNNMSLKQPLRVGQVLTIPPGGRLRSPAELATILKRAKAKKHRKRAARRGKAPRHSKIRHQPIPSDGTYVVKPGDSPWKIARRFGIKTSALLAANGLTRSSVLRIGQKLVIPRGGKATGVRATAAAAAVAVKPSPKPVRSETKPAQKSTDEILDAVEDPVESSDISQPASTGQPGTPKVVSSGSSELDNADTITLDAETTVQELAAKYGVSVKDLKVLNPDFPKDDKLEAGRIVLIPTKK